MPSPALSPALHQRSPPCALLRPISRCASTWFCFAIALSVHAAWAAVEHRHCSHPLAGDQRGRSGPSGARMSPEPSPVCLCPGVWIAPGVAPLGESLHLDEPGCCRSASLAIALLRCSGTLAPHALR